MHDRRIDGVPHTFGNASTLFMNAMTWYDHETRSIWSQPWGRAIQGPLKGVELKLLPFQLTTWESWRREHPKSLAMINEVDRFLGGRQKFDPDFVIGLAIAGLSKAYYFTDVREVGVVNDQIGDIPILVWAQDENFHAYVRQVADRILTFSMLGENIVDQETGSVWDVSRGIALEGPLSGESLQPVPSLSSYDWAWEDFYPDSEFYQP